MFQSTHWHYNVTVHQRRVEEGNAWRSEMPAHSFNESCRSEIRNYYNCNPYPCNTHTESYQCNPHLLGTCVSGTPGCVDIYVFDTCTQTVTDTCYDSCPNYEDMCHYSYPNWPVVQQADTSNSNRLIVRPLMNMPDVRDCGGDAEFLYIENPRVSQCTVDSLNFSVTFAAQGVGNFTIHPSTTAEYGRYYLGARWRSQYNNAGRFRPIRAYETHP